MATASFLCSTFSRSIRDTFLGPVIFHLARVVPHGAGAGPFVRFHLDTIDDRFSICYPAGEQELAMKHKRETFAARSEKGNAGRLPRLLSPFDLVSFAPGNLPRPLDPSPSHP